MGLALNLASLAKPKLSSWYIQNPLELKSRRMSALHSMDLRAGLC